MTRTKFSTFSWVFLIYTLVVIVLGALVRATVSGDGCGNNWPLCGGGDGLIPAADQIHRIIEFAHRVSVFLITPLIIIQVIWCFRMFAKGSAPRKSASLSTLFIVVEAIIGAVLVRKHLVAYDASVNRAIVMSAHLVSTFILLGSLGLTAAWSSGIMPPTLKKQGAVGWALLIGFIGVILLGVSGAVTALGDQLFPMHVTSIAEALRADLSPTANFLIRLRLYHPLTAVSVGVFLVLIAGLLAHLRPTQEVRRYAAYLGGLFIFELALGCLNFVLRAPVWMQLVHLFVADLVWVSLTMLAASSLATDAPRVEVVVQSEEERLLTPHTPVAILKQYLALTKPRVISLLLFTTITAMFAAARGWPGFWLLIAVSIGGYMSAGAANTINMVIDRDIDGTMKRTSRRPTVTQHISSRNALLFGFGMEIGSFAILWSAANLLCAMLALAGLAFYVVVYTLILKRRTWHNIVIGGAAGSFPPLVGWAAVTNQLTPLAWFLFAIIFVWTPVHFWALALMIKEDYARAGVPMLPVVRGERATVIQILLYAVLTAVISVLPIISHAGWTYLGIAILLNIVLLVRCVQLYLHTERPQAVTLYKFSMVYLALLFLAFAVDRFYVM
ncbi:MAG TPA: heme o synthase [Fimbriimonadaceae bacterium]|jgi:protoheme IX farnesyltransferase